MSNPKNKFDKFLSKRRVLDSGNFNIISIPGPNFSNGKYFIKDNEDFEKFIKLYNECRYTSNINTYFLEIPFNIDKIPGFDASFKDHNIIKIDLDFKYSPEIESRMHNDDDIMTIIETYLENIKEMVELDETIVEIATDKVDSEVPSTHEGKLVEQLFKVDDVVQVGDAFAIIETDGSDESEIQILEKKFKEDIKSRIDETSKYIKPQEKTLDYAFMFIPADGLYQDLLNSRVGSLKIRSKELVSYAYQKKVMIVSPMSLFPMLQITMKALNNLKFEKSIEAVIKNVSNLSTHLKTYQLYHEKIGNTLGTVVNHYNKSSDEFKKIDKDILKISEGDFSIDYEKQLIDKPRLND